jgi:hypothetical protein
MAVLSAQAPTRPIDLFSRRSRSCEPPARSTITLAGNRDHNVTELVRLGPGRDPDPASYDHVIAGKESIERVRPFGLAHPTGQGRAYAAVDKGACSSLIAHQGAHRATD